MRMLIKVPYQHCLVFFVFFFHLRLDLPFPHVTGKQESLILLIEHWSGAPSAGIQTLSWFSPLLVIYVPCQPFEFRKKFFVVVLPQTSLIPFSFQIRNFH